MLHIVLTRFNVQTYVTGRTDVISPDWFRRRLNLFETFCLPSMHAQSVACTWLVFFDVRTPPDLRSRIGTHSGYVPVWVDGMLDDERVSEYVGNHLPTGVTTLVTTRLDNDDAVASDFLLRIQQAAVGQDRLFVNLPFGYQWGSGRLYYYFHLANPFLSFVERVPPLGNARRPPTTVMSGSHASIARRGQVRQLVTPPMWIQVIHGGNVLNQLVGVRRSRLHSPDRFPAIPLATEGRLRRQADVARSVGHLAALAWQRRAQVRLRLAARFRRRWSRGRRAPTAR